MTTDLLTEPEDDFTDEELADEEEWGEDGADDGDDLDAFLAAVARAVPQPKGSPWWNACKLAFADDPLFWVPGRSYHAPPMGLEIVHGRWGKGKTAFMVAHAHAVREEWGDKILILSNIPMGVEDEIVNEPIELLRILVRELKRPKWARRAVALFIDEVTAWWDSREWQRHGPELLGLLANVRKLRLYILATLQSIADVDARVRRALAMGGFVWEVKMGMGKRLITARKYIGVLAARLAAREADEAQALPSRRERKRMLGRPLRVVKYVFVDELREAYETERIFHTVLLGMEEAAGERASKRKPRAARAPRQARKRPTREEATT